MKEQEKVTGSLNSGSAMHAEAHGKVRSSSAAGRSAAGPALAGRRRNEPAAARKHGKKDRRKVSVKIESAIAKTGADRGSTTTHPPLTNRGVFMSLGLDWLNFSKVCSGTDLHGLAEEVAHTFRTNRDLKQLKRGYEGIDLAYKGTLSWRGDHLRVELPGLAMQYVRYYLRYSDEEICEWFLRRGFKATRCDAAIDCADKVFNPLVAYRYKQNDNVRCEASSWDYEFSKAPKGKTIFPKNGKGMTTYCGSRFSDRMIRFYDKLGEMSRKTGEIPTDEFGVPLDHLTRIELQCRRKASNELARAVLANGVGVIKSVIAGYISFLNPRDKRKKRRRTIAPFWERIVGKERRYLTLPHVVSSPDSSMLWVKRQVVPTLKMMRDNAPDKFKELLEKWIDDYEANPKISETWKVWREERAERKAEQAIAAREATEEAELRAFRQKQQEMDEAAIEYSRTRMAEKMGEVATWVCWETGDDGERIVTAAFYEWELDLGEAV